MYTAWTLVFTIIPVKLLNLTEPRNDFIRETDAVMIENLRWAGYGSVMLRHSKQNQFFVGSYAHCALFICCVML